MTAFESSTLFDLLPIGAYRSTTDGRQLRANAALVRLNGYASEAELLAAVKDIDREWYVEPGRRQRFLDLMQRNGRVVNFVSQIYRHKTRERIWIRENAHVVRDANGDVLCFEGTVEDITESQQALQDLSDSERRFRALTEKARVLTLVCDAQGRISYASEATRSMLGRTNASMVGSRLTDWVHPDDAAAVHDALGAAARDEIADGEAIYRFRHADGSWHQLATLASNYLQEEAVQGIVLNCRDATERLRAEAAERALIENESRWKLALESAGDGVWDCDLLTGTQVFSRRFLDMYGLTEQDVATTDGQIDLRTHPDDVARRDQARQAHFDGLSPTYVSEHRIRCKDGSWKWVLSRGMLISRDEQGRPRRLIGTHTDITERKRAETAMQELLAELRDRSVQMQTILGSAGQGMCLADRDGRLAIYNQQFCELLDLPPSLLDTHPRLEDVTRFQLERGDFGEQGEWVDAEARAYVQGNADLLLSQPPSRYLRTTRAGRVLEVRTVPVPSGGFVRSFNDVTDYLQTERSLKRLNLLLEATQSLAHLGGWEVDLRTRQVFWTREVYRILEISPDAFTPTMDNTARFFTPESARQVAAAIADSHSRGTPPETELQMVTAKGRLIWIHAVSMVSRENGEIVKRTTVIQDITERKQTEAALRENEARWKLALESAGDGVWDWDIARGTEVFSPRFQEMYGFADGEMPDGAQALDDRTHPDDRAAMQQARQDHFDGRTASYVNEHRLRCKDGSWKWILSRGMVISRDANGRPLRMIGTHTDITDRKNAEALVWQQANFDPLTGLPNRRMLRDRLAQELKKTARDGRQLAILFVDLDHFKEVNDTLGHDAGDQLLIEAAQRIRSCVRDSDTVARMGGDEFTLVVSELDNTQRLDRILHDVLQAMATHFQIGDEQVYVSASIGITIYPTDGREVETLFRNADQALYVAKGGGRNRFSYFTPTLQQAAQARARLANDLRAGVALAQFHLVYQPIVSLTDGQVRKAEALLRWQHPSRGPVSPAEFIPIAEATGLIIEMGEWVFRQATQQAVRWRARHHPDFQVSVNKSPVQFHNDAGRQQRWGEHLAAIGLPGAGIVIEITEGLLLDTSAAVTEQLRQLRDAGIQVSLDDFGTGYSSLTYLQRFDIDTIKIDQSFVRNLASGSTDLALCKAIIVMAHELGMQVIAEGVETREQLALLVAAGCDFGQGYLFARPMTAADFDNFMENAGIDIGPLAQG